MSIVSSIKYFFAELESVDNDYGVEISDLPLVVGVSGGPDSVTLLHVLARRSVWSPDKIVVAHLDHLLRPNSAADASFVRFLAQEWQLQFRTKSVDVKELAKRKRMSIETAAREARYAFLTDVARETGAGFITTGHNQNDQAETVLMHIVRGSGLTGLRGMRSVSPAPVAPDLKILRPMLSVNRSSIEAYCRQNGLRYVEDKSNRDVSMFRNRVRHEMLPALLEYNPGIIAALCRLAITLEADEDLLNQVLNDSWSKLVIEAHRTRIALALGQWRALPLAIRRRSLRHGFLLLRSESSEIGFEAIELARRVAETGQVGDQATLPGNVLLTLEYEQLVLETPEYQSSPDEWPQLEADIAHSLPVPGQLRLGASWVIRAKRVSVINFDPIVNNMDSWRAYIRDDFADDLLVRTRQAGDRLRPLGMHGRSAKIGDIMTNNKIPVNQRERWPILASRDHPLWLVGHSLDDRARVQPDAQEVLVVRVERLGSVDEP